MGNIDRPPILSVRNLSVAYRVSGLMAYTRSHSSVIRAVDDVTLNVTSGRTLGIVGESGSGKSTLARAMVGLVRPTSGELFLDGRRVGRSRSDLRRLRSDVAMIFQSASASLDPRMRVGTSIAEPISGSGRRDRMRRVAELLDMVGLDPSNAAKYPHELSGGQLQRVGIARALAAEPRVIICDESVSGLDVSLQAQVLKLLGALQQNLGLTYVFISHDLAVVRLFAAQVAVMYAGRIVEEGSTKEIFEAAKHPYTQRLLSAIPLPDPQAERQRHSARRRGDAMRGAQRDDADLASGPGGP